MKLKSVYTIVALILIAVIFSACNDSEVEEEGEEKVVPVETAKAEKGDLTITKSVYGRLEPSQTTPVMLQNPGEIDKLEVADGDKVKEDDTIATIVSPMGNETVQAESDGMITNLDAKEGDKASNEDPLAVIADVDTMIITVNVTAKVQSLFGKDDDYKTVIDDEEYDATIKRIEQMPDDTGLYPVEATVDNDDGDILPGMIGRMDVPEKKVKDAFIVPTSAVVTEEGESFIFIVRDDKAEKMDVEVKETQSDKTAIDGDVEADDAVVVNGQVTLSDGSEVDVTKEENES